MEVMAPAADPRYPHLRYAWVQYFWPRITIQPSGTVSIPPVLDMLGIRYLVFRGPPLPKVRVDFSSPGYWVATNENALPRAFVPKRVETVADDHRRLALLAAPNFDPRQIAYVEQPVNAQAMHLPDICEGDAKIVEDTPTRMKMSYDMATAGLWFSPTVGTPGGKLIWTENPPRFGRRTTCCAASSRRPARERWNSAASRPPGLGACGSAGWPRSF